MKKPFTFLASSGGGPSADFHSMTLSGLWLDNYNGHTWVSEASAGTSGTGSGARDLEDTSTTAPAAGTSLNGHTTVRWNRANSEQLKTTAILNDFIPTDPHKWSFGMLVNVIDVVTNVGGGGSTYLNETYLGDAGGDWNVSAYSTGPTFTVGTWPTSSDLAFALTTWLYLQARGVPGGATQVRINGGSWTTLTTGSGISNRSFVLTAGRGNTAAYVNGTVAVMWIADDSLSDADFDFSLDCARAYSGLSL